MKRYRYLSLRIIPKEWPGSLIPPPIGYIVTANQLLQNIFEHAWLGSLVGECSFWDVKIFLLESHQNLSLPWSRSQASPLLLAGWPLHTALQHASGMEFCEKVPETQSGIEHYGKEPKREECRLKREVGLSLSTWWCNRFGVSFVGNMNNTLFSSFSKYSWEMGEGQQFQKPFWKWDAMVFRWSRKACLGWHRSEKTAWQCTITMLYTDNDGAEWLKVLDTRQCMAGKIPFLNFFCLPIQSTHTLSSAFSVPASLTKYPAKWL